MRAPPIKLKGNNGMQRWLNALREYVLATRPVGSNTVRTRETSNGTVIEHAQQKSGSTDVLWG